MNGAYVKDIIVGHRGRTMINHFQKTMDFMPANIISSKMTLLSNSAKLEKMFVAFNLDSIQEWVEIFPVKFAKKS